MDQVLKRAMDKRDEALREMERWTTWIKTYQELIEPERSQLYAVSPSTSRKGAPTDELDIPTSLRAPNVSPSKEKA